MLRGRTGVVRQDGGRGGKSYLNCLDRIRNEQHSRPKNTLMSKPLSAHRHTPLEQYHRAVISPFGGFTNVPVPAPPSEAQSSHMVPDHARTARTTLNPAKAAGGHAEMNSRNYGTGAAYTFRERVGGVMPGYSGHRPGARDVHHKMAYGGMPTFNRPSSARAPGQGMHLDNRPTTAFQEYGRGWKVPDETLSTDRFREAVGGVLCGYTGHVPHTRTHFGSSHVGGLSQVGSRGHLAQRGHSGSKERLQADKELDMSRRTLRSAAPVVGYRGHVPKAQEAFGTSCWKREAPNPERHQADLYSA